MSEKPTQEVCYICGGDLRSALVRHLIRYRQDGSCVVFGDVPALWCQACGEKYFDSQVTREMEAVLADKRATEVIELPFHSLHGEEQVLEGRQIGT